MTGRQTSNCVQTATMATNNETDANARTSTATARTMTNLLLERIGNIVRGMFYVNGPIVALAN